MAPSDASPDDVQPSRYRELLLERAGDPSTRGTQLLAGLASWALTSTPDDPDEVSPFAALRALDGEVGNGGWLQYFSNSAGDGWSQAFAALSTLDDREGRELVLAAGRVFGAAGPAAGQSQRRDHLASMSEAAMSPWDRLAASWVRHSGSLGIIIRQWVRANAPGLAFRTRTQYPLFFSFDCIQSPAAPQQWGRPIQELLITSEAFCSASSLSGSDALEWIMGS